MHIAILELELGKKSATGVRARAVETVLRQEGHTVDVLSPPADCLQRFNRYRMSYRARIARRVLRKGTLPHFWDYVADSLEPLLRRTQYDTIIGRGQEAAYVLTRGFDCRKILDMANIFFLERYYSANPNVAEVEETFGMEMELFRAVDHILVHHDLLKEYFLREVDIRGEFSDKVTTARMGCEPATRYATYKYPPRIVYAGSYYYIQDPWLLASLTKISPYAIDCYGPTDPNRRFLPAQLVYKGFSSTEAFLADYQFGLITVSRDSLRQSSPSTKFPYYFAHGLPVLFPDWMKEGYTYPQAAVSFNENNFVDRLREVSSETRWEDMSRAALAVAQKLGWDKTLQPLSALLSTGG